MLQLYRHILKAAKHFPSVKRNKIIQQIKEEFRENKVRANQVQKPAVCCCHSMYCHEQPDDCCCHVWPVHIAWQLLRSIVISGAANVGLLPPSRCATTAAGGVAYMTSCLATCAVDGLQTLTDPDKIAHCRAVAERGLSDLLAYVRMTAAADSGEMSITLKGATS
jgi:hypothetical protein